MADSSQISQRDKLLGTLRFAIIAGLIGAGLYFLGPTLGQMWREFQQAGEKGLPAVAAENSDKKEKVRPIPRTLSDFSMDTTVTGDGTNVHVNVRNNNPSTLSNVELTLALVGEDDKEFTVARSWTVWDPTEKKTIGLGNSAVIKACALGGKAQLGNEDVVLYGQFTFAFDSLGPGKFQVRTWQALVASYHNVYIMNKTGSDLTDVNIKLHVTYVSSRTHEGSRSWPAWNAGQEMTIDVPSHSKIQKIKWTGTATIGGRQKGISFDSLLK